MSADKPTGTGWVKVNGKLMNIDILDDEVVGTNKANNIFRCPMVAPPAPVKYSPCESGSDSCVRERGAGSLLPAGTDHVALYFILFVMKNAIRFIRASVFR